MKLVVDGAAQPGWILEDPIGTWKIESIDKADAILSPTFVSGYRDYYITQTAEITYTLEGLLVTT